MSYTFCRNQCWHLCLLCCRWCEWRAGLQGAQGGGEGLLAACHSSNNSNSNHSHSSWWTPLPPPHLLGGTTCWHLPPLSGPPPRGSLWTMCMWARCCTIASCWSSAARERDSSRLNNTIIRTSVPPRPPAASAPSTCSAWETRRLYRHWIEIWLLIALRNLFPKFVGCYLFYLYFAWWPALLVALLAWQVSVQPQRHCNLDSDTGSRAHKMLLTSVRNS